MSNRFEILFALDKNLFAEGSPVIISAGVLRRDSESNRLVAQLKFRNISPKTIWAVTVSLACVDTAGQPTSEVFSYQYQDLTAARGEEFGSKKAILIPNSNTRGFTVTELTAVFSDGSTHTVSAKLSPLPEQELLSTVLNDNQLVKQYRLATNDQAVFVPFTKDGLHLCPCGQWHMQPFCAACGLSHEQAEEAYDLPALTEAMNIRLEQEAADREEQRRTDVYNKAVADLGSGKLNRIRKAEEALVALGDYRDCPELVLQCHAAIKEIALHKMENPKSPFDYAEAEKIFRSLGDVDDCKALAEKCHAKYTTSKDHQTDKLKKVVKRVIIAAVIIALIVVMVPVSKTYIIPAVKYSQAEKLAEEAQYDEAIAAFEALGDYKDAHVRILDATYSKAEALMAEGRYTEAAEIFDELDDYLYSRDKLTECIYLNSVDLIAEQKYEDAITQLKTIGKYEDAPALLDNCYMTLAEIEYAAQRYNEALKYYDLVADLDTENTIYIDCVYQAALEKLTAGEFKDATELFTLVGDYTEAAAKRLEAMYAYAEATQTNPDDTAFTYLEELVEKEYEGAEDLLAAAQAAREEASAISGDTPNT